MGDYLIWVEIMKGYIPKRVESSLRYHAEKTQTTICKGERYSYPVYETEGSYFKLIPVIGGFGRRTNFDVFTEGLKMNYKLYLEKSNLDKSLTTPLPYRDFLILITLNEQFQIDGAKMVLKQDPFPLGGRTYEGYVIEPF